MTTTVTVDGYRLAYDEYGAGDRVVVLLHGLLMRRQLHVPLATALAARGYRVICLDLLGHGDSDRPLDLRCYSMPIFSRQVIGVMDQLGVEQAVVGGTSLGANVALEIAATAPHRLRAIVLEMPVLDNAVPFWGMVIAPLLLVHGPGAPALRLVGRVARLVPRGQYLLDILLDWLRQDPGPSRHVLLGLVAGRIAPPPSERRAIETPALVIGHPRDAGHPMSDATTLIKELPDARLVEARSIFELRVRPDRITREICQFLDGCWPAGSASRLDIGSAS